MQTLKDGGKRVPVTVSVVAELTGEDKKQRPESFAGTEQAILCNLFYERHIRGEHLTQLFIDPLKVGGELS